MSPKVMASFSAFGGDLPSIAFIVLHSLEGTVLWSSVSTNCLHVFLRCSFVVLVISSFICCRAGEVGSLDLRSSRALIFSNISAGTGSVLIRCRPVGICYFRDVSVWCCDSYVVRVCGHLYRVWW